MENSRILKILITNDDGIQSESMLSFAKSLLDIALYHLISTQLLTFLCLLFDFLCAADRFFNPIK